MFNKEILGKRIKKVRGKKSQDVFASELGISRGALSFYENGERTPDAEIIYKICELCNVSADYLLGFTDNSTTDTALQAICEYTGLGEDAVNKLRDDITESNFNGEELYHFKQVRDYLIESEFFALFTETYSSLYVDSKSQIEAVKQFSLGKVEFPNDLDLKCDIHRYNIIKYAENCSDDFDLRVFRDKENTVLYKNKMKQVQDNGEHNPPKE